MKRLISMILALALLLCCATALALDKNVNMSVNLDMEDGVYQTLARKTFSLRVQLDKEGLTALRINFGDSMEYVNYWGEDWDNLLATGVLETGAWFSSGDYEMYAERTVAEPVTDPACEISLADAQKLNSHKLTLIDSPLAHSR